MAQILTRNAQEITHALLIILKDDNIIGSFQLCCLF